MRLPGKPQLDPPDRVVRVLQDDQILFSNQPIAVAIADTLERARHAALLVRASLDAEPHTVSLEHELSTAEPHDITAGGHQTPADKEQGNVDEALKTARHRIEQLYETPPHTHNPMEPHATLAHWDAADHLTVFDATQWVFAVSRKLAQAFALKPEQVHVIAKFVGGAFGCKGLAVVARGDHRARGEAVESARAARPPSHADVRSRRWSPAHATESGGGGDSAWPAHRAVA